MQHDNHLAYQHYLPKQSLIHLYNPYYYLHKYSK
nr:MAG TPA: hypothetical protein [Caudoviricetes sp.]